MKKDMQKKPQISLEDDYFGAILNCAVRYSLGRQSYMPSLVTDFIRPLLPHLSDKTIAVFKNDLEGCICYGDPAIDEPIWKNFLFDVIIEYQKRKESKK